MLDSGNVAPNTTLPDDFGQNDNENTLAWGRVVTNLKQVLDSQIFSAYIRPLRAAPSESDRVDLLVYAPNTFVCNHISTNYGARIQKLLAEELGKDTCDIKFAVDPSASEQPSSARPVVVLKKSRPAENGGITTFPYSSTGLNQRYNFDNYVVGSSNQFCHAASFRVAEQPGMNYNPLFIYGGVGLGKTHLLHAIGNLVISRNPQSKVVYMSSEYFTNELIQALRNARMDDFKSRFRSIDVLLIDDIQFMCGKERTQEEFFHTFNALYNAKHQIVVTSDQLPQDIPGLEERLQTRFAWGLIADLQAPDFETRVAILKHKALTDGVTVPHEVYQFIAEHVSSNVRELEGALTKVLAMGSLQGHEINIELAEKALQHILQPKQVNIGIDEIKRVVAHHFNLKTSDLSSKRRTRNISFPRHIAMYLCRKHTTSSYPEIGYNFGGRDHSSVIHGSQVVQKKVETEARVKELVMTIEKRLQNPN